MHTRRCTMLATVRTELIARVIRLMGALWLEERTSQSARKLTDGISSSPVSATILHVTVPRNRATHPPSASGSLAALRPGALDETANGIARAPFGLCTDHIAADTGEREARDHDGKGNRLRSHYRSAHCGRREHRPGKCGRRD